ncbi:MAG: radical SAM protein [Spirochaetia bacterium]|nr:radical SAM protein [Spirochaetia bacterium]
MNDNILDIYRKCHLCGRGCGTDRTSACGFCRESDQIRIACALLHKGEEPPITGKNGSGTIFFTGCTLQCKFCQNHQISRGGIGKEVSVSEFAGICMDLQNAGAENINLVTGTQFIPSIALGIAEAREKGLKIPVLWNSSGYETAEMLDIVNTFTDVYLPDLKTLNHHFAAVFFNASDYPERAKESVIKMAESKPLVFKDDKIISGTIIRHLVIPGYLEMTERVLKWYSENLKDKALLSVMFQYSPKAASPEYDDFPQRILDRSEMDMVYSYLDEYGIEDGFIQEDEITEEWNPDFNKLSPFPGGTGRIVWHWKTGRNS